MRGLYAVATPILFVVLLAACGGSSTGAITTTSSASPSPKPAPDASGLLASIKGKGVAVGEVQVYTADSDPNSLLGRPHQYVTKVNWHDTRIAAKNFDIDGGGSIETFSVTADLASRVVYVSGITQGAAIFAEYEFSSQSGLFFLRLSHYLTPTQAMDYEAALQTAFPDLKKD